MVVLSMAHDLVGDDIFHDLTAGTGNRYCL